MNEFDFILIGQGLAGTTLAWRLLQRGAHVLVVDRGDRQTPSRLAAGLLTPITGKRLAVSEDWAAYWPAAEAFYRGIEPILGVQLLSTQSAVRLFDSADEASLFSDRSQNREFDRLVRTLPSSLNLACIQASYGGFEMSLGGRLEVAAYLDASRLWFSERGAFRTGEVGLGDVHFTDQGAEVASLAASARRVIFCRGMADRGDFDELEFEPVKGEMLTVRIEDTPTRTLHRGIWLAPVGKGVYRLGATYDRDRVDQQPTLAGRQELETKLRGLLRTSYEVLDHQAAIRPVLAGRQATARLLDSQPRVGVFNGLGSKGALWAPLIAERFGRQLVTI